MSPAQLNFLQLRNSDGIIYLDGAAEGLLPELVLERLNLFTPSDASFFASTNVRIMKSVGRKFRSVFFLSSLENGLLKIFKHFRINKSLKILIDPGLPDPMANLAECSNQTQVLIPSEKGELEPSHIPGGIREKHRFVLLNHINPISGTERNIEDFNQALRVQSETDNKDIFLFVDGSSAFSHGLPMRPCDLYIISFGTIFGLPGYACFCSDKLHSALAHEVESKTLQDLMDRRIPRLSTHIFAEFSDYLQELREGLIPNMKHPENSVAEMVCYLKDNFPEREDWRIYSFSTERGLVFLEGPQSQIHELSFQLRDYGIIHSFGTLSEMGFSKLNPPDLHSEKKLFRFSIQWYNSMDEIHKLCNLLKILIRR